ncbi:MAG: hypothetical protein ACREIF_16310 [Chthoniobacterales bacterium]
MKLTASLALFLLALFQSGCAIGPSIDEQTREQTQQQQVEKRSDAFARGLPQ